jgi:hypothetical protein
VKTQAKARHAAGLALLPQALPGVDLPRLAGATDGFTSADLKRLESRE